MEVTSQQSEETVQSVRDERPVGYLELLNRGGRVIQRLPVRHRRINVGRAYDNDLIIDDPYICPHHLTFQWNGERLGVIDRDSVNGISIDGRTNGEPLYLACGEQLRIGRTTLRFRSADFEVAPAHAISKGVTALDLFSKPLVPILGFLLLAGQMLLDEFLSKTTKFDLLEATSDITEMLIAVMLWSMLWGFASRVLLHRWNFWSHCGVIMVGLNLFYLSEVLVALMVFSFNLDSLNEVLTIAINFLLFGLVLFVSLHFTSMAPPKKLLRSAFIVSAVVIGLILASDIAELDDFSNEPGFSVTLQPPALKLAASRSVDSFFADTSGLFDEVNGEVAEAGE